MPWMVAVLSWDADKKTVRGPTRCDSPRELLAQQFNVYSPRMRELVARHGRRVWVVDWLFGRYAFVEKLADWRDVFRHRAVSEILTDGQKNPALARDEEIYRFRDLEDRDGYVVLPEHRRSKLRRGDACRVTEGSFAGMDAVYRGMGRRERELALVEFMGRRVQIEVAAGALVPA